MLGNFRPLRRRFDLSEVDATITEKKDDSNNRSTIRGRVTYARGVVPLASVMAGTSSTTTDITGSYELSNLDRGTYEVTVTPPKEWRYEAKPQTVELAPGEVKVVDFRLEKVVPETILEGHVYGADQMLANGAELSGVICGTDLASTTTDSNGHFIFRNVKPGNRFVRVSLSGHLGEVRDFAIEEGQRLSLDFHLEKAMHRIYGSIVNHEGKPVKAAVHLYHNGVIVQKRETTPEDGNFDFAVKEAEYSILVQAPYYNLDGWNGMVTEDKKLEFKLVPIRETESAPIEPFRSR
jgi:hypothetical protein